MGLYEDPIQMFAFPNLPNSLSPPTNEIQFSYSGTLGHILKGDTPVVRAVFISLPRGRTKTQVRASLRKQLRKPLDTFLHEVRPLASQQGYKKFGGTGRRIHPKFGVRLLMHPWELDWQKNPILELFTGPVQKPDIVAAQLNIDLSHGRRLSSMLYEIVDLLLPILDEIIDFTPTGGRPPNTSDVAHWWALTVFEGLSVPEIAKRVSVDSPDAPNVEDRIGQALRRVGFTPGVDRRQK